MNLVLSETDKKFSALLLDFYGMIKQDKKEAAAILAEVMDAMKKEVVVEEMLVSADLLAIRYKIMQEDIHTAEKWMEKFEALGHALSQVNAYYYHYFKGQILFQEKRWKEAIRYYEHAELYLAEEEEKSDFYYKLASAYYHAYIPALSAFNTAKALHYATAYKQQLHLIKSKLLLGLNYLEVRNFNQAEFYLLESLSSQTSSDNTSTELVSMIHHNLGLLYFVQLKFEEAVLYFEKAVQTASRSHYLKTIYYLTESLFHADRQQEAMHYHQIGFEKSKEEQDLDYQWAFAMLHKQFVDRNCFEGVWEQGIAYFKSIGDKYSVHYYSLRMAKYYSVKGKAEPANYYYRLAMQ
ncbi:response regulator aspartate phosphatase C [Terribacillus aidingensis]|uniref:Response regulator aspartate phosphatase C n=1 Tax=Terribacillus aidingensis TaxID=586416 RepID=A0A285P2A3_9BACI|nr:hypothetical protein [Terribacillus aidingensis]SNZ15407.1 response regulator aspartate phosphatase C [Terribacillus aidingensis]